MNFNNEKQLWTRTCPQCNKTVEHKSKGKCQDAEKYSRPCITCSRSNIGKRNSFLDTCPVCNEQFAYRHDLEKHATTHNKTGEELWCLKSQLSPPLCRCGCGQKTRFFEWNKPWPEFIVGHNASIYDAYTPEVAAEIAKTRGVNWRGNSMWKGQTKENNESVRKRAEATSAGWKELVESGWEHPTKGHTKDTHPAVAKQAQTAKEQFASGERVPLMKGKDKHTDEGIARMAAKISITLSQRSIRQRLDELKRLTPEEIKRRIERSGRLELVDKPLNYVNDNDTQITVRCKVCKNEFEKNLRHLQLGRCLNCDPQGSAGQQEVATYVWSLGFNIRTNDRSVISPQELDIFVPSRNFAIEYNGLHYHSELRKSRTFHDNKTVMCQKLGIDLLHIFEDEWFEKTDIVKSLIAHRLGKTPNKVFARKCKIVPLTFKESRQFFEQNHIDGDTPVKKKAWGLEHNGKIVAALSIRTPHHRSLKQHMEIARFCTALNTAVPGALGRLSHVALQFTRDSGLGKTLLTYVDTRVGHGRGYEAAGFKFLRMSPIRFWWLDEREKVRFNRFKFRADAKEKLTERQVALEHGVIKIWGCSNRVFVLE